MVELVKKLRILLWRRRLKVAWVEYQEAWVEWSPTDSRLALLRSDVNAAIRRLKELEPEKTEEIVEIS